MATISFSQRPQKNFYSYTKDGHIYSISASEPSEIKDKGGYGIVTLNVHHTIK